MSARAVGPYHLRATRWCVFISGRGSNLAALLETCDVDVRLVVASSADAAGCAKARRAGIPVLILSKPIDWDSLHQHLRDRSIDAIFLLGFMRIVPEKFILSWEGRILNLHPSLLPKYPGLKSIERAYADGHECGATIHEVVPEVDAGQRLLSRVSVTNEQLALEPSARFKFESVETMVHIDEQRLVKEIVEKWRPKI